MQQSEDTTFVSVDARESSGSARSRLPYGESLSRNRTERGTHGTTMAFRKRKTGKRRSRRTRKRRCALYAGQRLHNHDAREARSRGRCCTSNRKVTDCITDRSHTHTAILRRLEGFGAVDELVTMVTGGVPVNAADTEVDLECTLQYGNHRGVSEHLPAIWKKIGEDVRRQKC